MRVLATASFLAGHQAPGPSNRYVRQLYPVVLAYVALGANLGNAALALKDAATAIGGLPNTQLVSCSSLYRTGPVGHDLSGAAVASASFSVQAFNPDYINAVVSLETDLTAPALLNHLQRIEAHAGRERPYVNAPRTLDLDLLLYGSASIDSAQLTVPHPRMWQRAFVLVPLAEITDGVVSMDQLIAVKHQAIERLGML